MSLQLKCARKMALCTVLPSDQGLGQTRPSSNLGWREGAAPHHPDPVLRSVSAGKALLLTRDPYDGWRSGGLGPQRLLPISSLPDGI